MPSFLTIFTNSAIVVASVALIVGGLLTAVAGAFGRYRIRMWRRIIEVLLGILLLSTGVACIVYSLIRWNQP